IGNNECPLFHGEQIFMPTYFCLACRKIREPVLFDRNLLDGSRVFSLLMLLTQARKEDKPVTAAKQVSRI
ncbi:hypothetical protein ISN45_At01g007340, partial [Arabidopsis thaliana x Arabidopsis arenosa]